MCVWLETEIPNSSKNKQKIPHPIESCVITSYLIKGFPHLNVCFCYTSQFATPARSYHLTFTSWTVAVMVPWPQSVYFYTLFWSGVLLHLMLLRKGDSSLWNHVACPPFPTSRCFPSAVVLPLLSHPALLYVKRVRWCRAPVSFILSRCFSWDTYENIETLMKTTLFIMLGHVGSCCCKHFHCFPQGKHRSSKTFILWLYLEKELNNLNMVSFVSITAELLVFIVLRESSVF